MYMVELIPFVSLAAATASADVRRGQTTEAEEVTRSRKLAASFDGKVI